MKCVLQNFFKFAQIMMERKAEGQCNCRDNLLSPTDWGVATQKC